MGLLILTTSCSKDEGGNNPTSITDKDNNVYTSVTIGTQVWMVENLKTTKLNDGTTAIPLVTDYTAWRILTTPGYCWYNNEIANKSTYGAMYNWYAVGTGKLCPTGWHVPSDAEWTTLTTFLGGETVTGGKLKEAGIIHWVTPNTGATNISGFTALPGGYRGAYGDFGHIGIRGYWWSVTESGVSVAYSRSLGSGEGNVLRGGYEKNNGQSVRCLKDN
jgi:uncharacterized protein (TIGR02145 family)